MEWNLAHHPFLHASLQLYSLLVDIFTGDRFSNQDGNPAELDCSLNISPLWPDFLILSRHIHEFAMPKLLGGDGIQVELFQILKDDTVKVLHSIGQQIWKTHQWPQDWKRSVFIPVPKKGNAKECSNYRTIALISHASKVMLKILQARLQQYVNCELPDVQAGFRKGRGTRD